MKFVDEFRDPAAARKLLVAIEHLAGAAPDHFKFMEVCGGHTHTIYRHGIEHLLPDNVELVHGPGLSLIHICGSCTDSATFAGLFARPPIGKPLPAWSLTADQAIITALGNDVGFELVFARQLIARAKAGDIAVAMSTSGNSPNLLAALAEARRRGLYTIGFAGYGGGAFLNNPDVDACFVAVSYTHLDVYKRQVIEQHEPTRCGHSRVGVVEPQYVVGHTGPRSFAAANPNRGGAPRRASAHHRSHVGIVRTRDRNHDVAGPHRDSRQINKFGSGQRHCRQCTFPYDHRMHELDRYM